MIFKVFNYSSKYPYINRAYVVSAKTQLHTTVLRWYNDFYLFLACASPPFMDRSPMASTQFGMCTGITTQRGRVKPTISTIKGVQTRLDQVFC